MSFKVGQKVVCIEVGEINFLEWDGFCPVKGEIYQINQIYEVQSEIYLQLVGSGDDIFHNSYFRPLDYDFVEEVIEQVKPKEVETSLS